MLRSLCNTPRCSSSAKNIIKKSNGVQSRSMTQIPKMKSKFNFNHIENISINRVNSTSFASKSASITSFQRFYAAAKIVTVQNLGDSITEGTLTKWEKNVGDFAAEDEVVARIETDKVTIESKAPENGFVREHFAKEGESVLVGSNLFSLEPGSAPASAAKKEAPKKEEKAAPAKETKKEESAPAPKKEESKSAPAAEKSAPKAATPAAESSAPSTGGNRSESRTKMSRMRLRVAERLKDAQNTAAMLTTFNKIDMSALMNMRKTHQDAFVEKHGVKLGFMSAFVKASAIALKQQPSVNAYIEGSEIVYHDFVDISVAVASPTGLVVPVLRNVEKMGFADIEKSIADYGKKAKDGKMTLEDMAGGTFTISNGGVFGSLMGTPILNPPQSAILGMHAINKEAVVVNDQVVIRPIMYVALTYDHRIIDGREAVTFLKTIKEIIEDPTRIVLDL